MSTTKRNWIYGVTATVVLIVILELLLRVGVNLSADYLSQREEINHDYRLWQMHLFNTFLGMNEPDPDLFWRLKPNYQNDFINVNSEGFAGPEIAAKQEGEYRALFLGDSTPLGLGLNKADESFVRQLEELLRTRVSDKQISVVNASVAGYTSWQCRKQLEKIGEKLQPDLVITYFGNNDPSINGYLSDRELYEQTRKAGAANRILAHSYIYQLLKDVVLGAKERAQAGKQLKARVPVEEAQENVAAINQWCISHSAGLIICTVPTPDLWPPGIQFKVFTGDMDSKGRIVMAEEMQGKLNEQWALCLDTLLLPGQSDQWTQQVYESSYRDGRSPVEAAAEYQRLLERTPGNARLWNNLGVALWEQGLDADSAFATALALDSLSAIASYNAGIAEYHRDQMRAEVFLKHAKELDNYSLRIKSAYNECYRRYGHENGITLADIEPLFSGLAEREYFVDHCHPTLRGHELIAGELVEMAAGMVK
ncbi:MAG: GDSL-type esterase/lipase family protein [Candidatus Zixiibacteriota bacterium]